MLDRIRASLVALPPAEQRVARLLIEDPRGFATMPVAELARRAQVSKPTVVRFCRSVGYDGLADFKLKLAGSVSEGVPFVHRAVDADDKVGEIAVKVIDNSVAALLRHRNAMAGQALEQAVATLAAAARGQRRIEFYGVGNSGIVAQDAQHKFFRLGVHTAAVSDGHVMVMSATLLGAGDVAVLISNSGRSRDLNEAADIARRGGATLLALTASGSPLARRIQAARQVLLAADHDEDAEAYSPMVSRLLHLVTIDILVTAVALRLGSEALAPTLQRIKRNLRSARYVDERTPAAGPGAAPRRGSG